VVFGLILFLALSPSFSSAADKDTPALAIASLTDPAKLATPGRWTENPAFII